AAETGRAARSAVVALEEPMARARAAAQHGRDVRELDRDRARLAGHAERAQRMAREVHEEMPEGHEQALPDLDEIALRGEGALRAADRLDRYRHSATPHTVARKLTSASGRMFFQPRSST